MLISNFSRQIDIVSSRQTRAIFDRRNFFKIEEQDLVMKWSFRGTRRENWKLTRKKKRKRKNLQGGEMDGKGNKRRLDLIALSAVATWKSKEMRSEQRWECNWLGNLRKTPSFLAVLPLLGSLTVHKSFVEKFPRERIRGTSGEVSSWFSSVTILR